METLLDTHQASEYLNIDPKSLANSRSTGIGINLPFIKVGKLVRYKLSDLEAYIESRTYNTAGEAKEAMK